ncbi:hypothetical protein M0R45_027018 [Rubus argutus]|uniref:Uncharacterized protein n=1 Tax=Rubus argutus TaxID=59490 RepID=A0AAW1WZU4_RUBAR
MGKTRGWAFDDLGTQRNGRAHGGFNEAGWLTATAGLWIRHGNGVVAGGYAVAADKSTRGREETSRARVGREKELSAAGHAIDAVVRAARLGSSAAKVESGLGLWQIDDIGGDMAEN